MNVRYRLLTVRGVALPLAICAGAVAALPFFSGLPLPSAGRAPAAAPPAPGVQRLTHAVVVSNVSNVAGGCRWQPSPDPAVQIADCGDERSTVRVVFEQGRVTQYRLNVIQSSSAAPAPAGVAPHTASGAPSYSISGPPEATKITPQSPLIRALNSSTAPAYRPAG